MVSVFEDVFHALAHILQIDLVVGPEGDVGPGGLVNDVGRAGALEDGVVDAAAVLYVLPHDLQAVEGQVGGGSVPTQTIPSWAVGLEGNVDALEEKLRLGENAIVGRIHDGRYLLDVRTLWPEDFALIVRAVKEAMA